MLGVLARHHSEYLSAGGIEEFYKRKYDSKNEEFWKKIELPGGADDSNVCIGVKGSNYFILRRPSVRKVSAVVILSS